LGLGLGFDVWGGSCKWAMAALGRGTSDRALGGFGV